MIDIQELAKDDAARAKAYGNDINPFSTNSARGTWRKGWEGVEISNLTIGSEEWRQWERGRQARILHEAQSPTEGSSNV